MDVKLEKFKDHLQQWNRDVFGNLFYRKRALLRRLEGLYYALSRAPNGTYATWSNCYYMNII